MKLPKRSLLARFHIWDHDRLGRREDDICVVASDRLAGRALQLRGVGVLGAAKIDRDTDKEVVVTLLGPTYVLLDFEQIRRNRAIIIMISISFRGITF